MPTTPKLIPFDINIAVKHPERVRDTDGNIPIQIAYFPEAAPLRQVLVLFHKNAEAIPFSETGCSWRDRMIPALFLTAETKHSHWTSIDEVPEGVYFKRKSVSEIHLATGFAPMDVLIFLQDRWYSPAALFHDWEYSPNRNGPWLPCGKEIAA